MPDPTSRPEESKTTAPTAGLGDTKPMPARASSSALRMCRSSAAAAAVIRLPVPRLRLRFARVEDDARVRCDRHEGLPVRASDGRAALSGRAVFAGKKANGTLSVASVALL